MKIASYAFILSLSFLFSHAALALDLPIAQVRKIVISGNAANVEFVGDAKAKALQIQFSAEAQNVFEVSQSDGVIEIRATDLKDKETFGKTSAGARTISVRGPARPVELHLMQGKVTANAWQDALSAVVQKGDFISRSGDGALSVSVQKGLIDVQKHRGKVTVDTYAASTVLKTIDGDLRVENFSGEATIDTVNGNLLVKVGSGTAKVINSVGTLDFETVKGTLTSQAFKGRVEGEVDEGNVTIVLGTAADIHVKSQTGRVSVTGAEKVGAYVNATAQGGDIFGPSYLKVAREGNLKLLKGRFRGGAAGASGGAIVVKSQEGSIFLK